MSCDALDMPTLRLLTPADGFDTLTALLHRAYAPQAARGLHFVATWQGPDITADRCSRGETWVLDDHGALVGTVTLEPPGRTVGPKGDTHYSTPGVAKFGQFAIDPDRKGQGLGRRLLTHIEDRARGLGATELACDTSEHATDLIAMYERLGFAFVEHIDWRPQVNYRSALLSKRLTGSTAG